MYKKRDKLGRFIKGVSQNVGPENAQWKGINVGYRGLHQWVRRHLPKQKNCELCSINTILEVGNISFEYKRDLSDWKWICHPCNMKITRRNMKKPPINNTSGFRGVYWDKQKSKWIGRIQVKGKNIYMGSYKNIKAAAKVMNKTLYEYYG